MEEHGLSYYFENPDACPVPFGNAKFPWDLLAEKDKFLKSFKFEAQLSLPQNVVVNGSVHIGKNTVIEPFTIIEGPVYIGANCLIRSTALIRPGTVIGNDAVIGHGAEIKNALVFDEAKIQGQTFVGDSVIGKGARIGSGVITGNRRFDQEKVKIRINDGFTQLDTDKFGCIIGDFVRIGANAATAPGICIGKFSWVYPQIFVKGFVPKESFLKLNQTILISKKEKTVLKPRDIEGKI